MYDSQSTFMRPKLRDGSFVKGFIPKVYTPYFCESNAWQYFWSVPQNIEGLIEVTGGHERFEQKLDSMFTLNPLPEDKLPIFSTGMIGQYAHGNEPSHHVGYLYNYVNKPWKTQSIVRDILDSQYKNTPNGHCGNEDCGQMSSWYIFSSLGFYPVKSIVLNNQEINRSYITHKEIMNGGTLVFKMGDAPNTSSPPAPSKSLKIYN